MLAPKDETLYIEVICIKDVRELDDVWGFLVINEGDIRPALRDHNWDGCHLIKYDDGMWPVNKSHFKTLDELRDDKLKDLGI